MESGKGQTPLLDRCPTGQFCHLTQCQTNPPPKLHARRTSSGQEQPQTSKQYQGCDKSMSAAFTPSSDPPTTSRPRSPYELAPIARCKRTSELEQVDEWIHHVVDFHMPRSLSSKSTCWFCDAALFKSPPQMLNDLDACLRHRTIHIIEHIQKGYKGKIGPDFHVFQHFLARGIISQEAAERMGSYSELPITFKLPKASQSSKPCAKSRSSTDITTHRSIGRRMRHPGKATHISSMAMGHPSRSYKPQGILKKHHATKAPLIYHERATSLSVQDPLMPDQGPPTQFLYSVSNSAHRNTEERISDVSSARDCQLSEGVVFTLPVARKSPTIPHQSEISTACSLDSTTDDPRLMFPQRFSMQFAQDINDVVQKPSVPNVSAHYLETVLRDFALLLREESSLPSQWDASDALHSRVRQVVPSCHQIVFGMPKAVGSNMHIQVHCWKGTIHIEQSYGWALPKRHGSRRKA